MMTADITSPDQNKDTYSKYTYCVLLVQVQLSRLWGIEQWVVQQKNVSCIYWGLVKR